MFGYSKLPSTIKSLILFHVAGLVSVLALFLYLINLYLTGSGMSFASQLLRIDPYERHFKVYLNRFGKNYVGEEYFRRLANFKRSMSEIREMSNDEGETAQYGPNKFSDMTNEEFVEKMLIKPWVMRLDDQEDLYLNCSEFTVNYNSTEKIYNIATDLPKDFDWRNEHVVGPVLDQKECRSCWAFSIVGVMESMMLISKQAQKYNRLSVQELTDCSKYTLRCSGGNPARALKFLCNTHFPITTEKDYPLTNVNGICKGEPKAGVGITTMTVKYNMAAEDIVRLIATHGPVVTTVSSYTWKNYLGGVIQRRCSNRWSDANHVVQIVGYKRTAEVPYFILRNSWGEDFGNEGYVYVAMEGFLCGVGGQISYFTVGNMKAKDYSPKKHLIEELNLDNTSLY